MRWLIPTVLILLAWPNVSCSAPAPAPGSAADLVTVGLALEDLPAEVAEPYHLLTDVQAPLDQRRAAAAALLAMDRDEARRALAASVARQWGPPVWQPVLEAITFSPAPPPKALAEPLMNLLGAAEGTVQSDLASALGRFGGDDELSHRLAELAGDRRQSLAARQAAALALGHHRTQDAAAALIALCQPHQPEALQQTAFTALACLTGIDRFGSDAAAWDQWWERARRLPRSAWREGLIENMAHRAERRQRQQQQTEQRFAEAQRTLYRAASPDDRPALLAKMLGDPLAPVRQLAMDLAVQRLVDDLPFEEPLRIALRARLDDPADAVRQRTTLLLRDLADAPAADEVARRLAEGRERSVSVLRADLLIMTRLPRAAAVEAVMDLLTHPSLRAEAAGALAAAAEAGLLSSEQTVQARRRARADLNHGALLPQMVTLLAHVGGEGDWRRIGGWLDHTDAAIRQAAARAWAQSDRPLGMLAEHSADPLVAPIFIHAAARRGRSVETLRALVEHPPGQESLAESWRQALEAMAGRVPVEAVLDAVGRLREQGQPEALRERLLTAALNAETEAGEAEDERAKAQLLLARAQARLAQASPAQALVDFQAAAALPVNLGDAQRAHALESRIEAHLLLGQFDEAFALAREVLGVAQTQPAPRGEDGGGLDRAYRLPMLFLDAAGRLANGGQSEQAAQVLDRLGGLLGPTLPPALADRVALIRTQIAVPADPADNGTKVAVDGEASAPPAAPTTQPSPLPMIGTPAVVPGDGD